MKRPIRGLYALCDTTFSPHLRQEQLARLLLEGGASILQLRMKGEGDLDRIHRTAQAILDLKNDFSFTFILNDYVDVAAALPVDGVHVGENDLSIRKVREKVGEEVLIGYSSHSLQEALGAEGMGADYVAFGAIFPTQTKGPGHPIQGLKKLRAVVDSLMVPVVAIGGINRENVSSVLETGVAAVAMISALTQAEDVSGATRFFIDQMDSFLKKSNVADRQMRKS